MQRLLEGRYREFPVVVSLPRCSGWRFWDTQFV